MGLNAYVGATAWIEGASRVFGSVMLHARAAEALPDEAMTQAILVRRLHRTFERPHATPLTASDAELARAGRGPWWTVAGGDGARATCSERTARRSITFVAAASLAEPAIERLIDGPHSAFSVLEPESASLAREALADRLEENDLGFAARYLRPKPIGEPWERWLVLRAYVLARVIRAGSPARPYSSVSVTLDGKTHDLAWLQANGRRFVDPRRA